MNWEELKQEYAQLNEQLLSTTLDKRQRGELQKRASVLAAVLGKHQEIETLKKTHAELIEQASQDKELASLYQEEVEATEAQLKRLEVELEDALYPADEKDSRNVFVEIRAGAGGQEAALFVGDLFKMYSAYALTKRWEVSVVSSSTTDLGGFKELVMYIKGKNVYKYLKYESGVHRVQRVPQTETQGRVHTSTVTVAVLPEAEDVDVVINPNDLRIDVYRSGGPGGQSVNTTDSAVRITHIPTGLVVTCQDERSQIKNKAKAMKVLQSRLLEMETQRQEAELSEQRKSQIGSGMRSEKIRTYNFPQNRVTDHRVDVTLKKLDAVMAGDLDDLIEPLIAWSREERRKHGPALA